MQIVIFATGADLDDIDAYERMPHPIRFFDDDYTVKGGLHKLVKQMYTQLCKPDLHTAEVVFRVDYSGPKVKVHTTRTVYEAKNVFLSFPLGVLKRGWIQFVPALP
jgi:polyamine oxidase